MRYDEHRTKEMNEHGIKRDKNLYMGGKRKTVKVFREEERKRMKKRERSSEKEKWIKKEKMDENSDHW